MKILKLEEYKSSVFEIGETVILQNVIEVVGKWNGKECKISQLLSNNDTFHSYNGAGQRIPAGNYGVLFEGKCYQARPDQIRKK